MFDESKDKAKKVVGWGLFIKIMIGLGAATGVWILWWLWHYLIWPGIKLVIYLIGHAGQIFSKNPPHSKFSGMTPLLHHAAWVVSVRGGR